MSRSVAVIWLLSGLTATSGCFSYVPTEFGAVPEGERVQVHLTRQGLADVPEIPDDVGTTLRGRLVGVDGDHVIVRVPLTERPAPLLPAASVGRDLNIPVSGIERIERRQFSRTRTAIAVLGAVAAVLAVVTGVGDDDGGAEPPPGPPSEESSRIPIPPS